MTEKTEGECVECPECKGSGRGGVPGMFTTNRNCSHCGGTGRVESPDAETPTREQRHAALDEMAEATPDKKLGELLARLIEVAPSVWTTEGSKEVAKARRAIEDHVVGLARRIKELEDSSGERATSD